MHYKVHPKEQRYLTIMTVVSLFSYIVTPYTIINFMVQTNNSVLLLLMAFYFGLFLLSNF